MDDSFFGPASTGKRGRGAEAKKLVFVAVSTLRDKEGREHPGFAHAFVADNASAETINAV